MVTGCMKEYGRWFGSNKQLAAGLVQSSAASTEVNTGNLPQYKRNCHCWFLPPMLCEPIDLRANRIVMLSVVFCLRFRLHHSELRTDACGMMHRRVTNLKNSLGSTKCGCWLLWCCGNRRNVCSDGVGLVNPDTAAMTRGDTYRYPMLCS
jgi:hypothetical protein